MNTRSRTTPLALALMSLGLACSTPSDNFDPAYVKTADGWLHGQALSSYNMRWFQGIPFAKPPVGALRWKAPEDPTPWTNVREAVTAGNHCPQPDTSSWGASFGRAGGKEDCLYLNVQAPIYGGPFPVLVWIHGGAFYMGRGQDYFAPSLVNKGVVVVSINYRIGTLGFMAHPAIRDANGKSGNYGFLDQIKALDWVQRNIARFGGDPGNVTIAGQSAGGASVMTLMASPLATGKFHKAIVQSGGFVMSTTSTQAQMEAAFTNTTPVPTHPAIAGCNSAADQAACLYALTADQILSAQPESMAAYGPVVDSYLLTSTVAANFAVGPTNRVPLLAGSTRDEFTSLLVSLPGIGELRTGVVLPNVDPTVSNVAKALGGDALAGAAALYPIAKYSDNATAALSALLTDALFACPTRAAARLMSVRTPSVYYYEFNDPNAPMSLQPLASIPYGAYHASELQYIFDFGSTLTTAQTALALEMKTKWYNFIAAGVPSSDWPAYTVAADQIWKFSPTGSGVMTDFDNRTMPPTPAGHKCTLLTPPAAG